MDSTAVKFAFPSNPPLGNGIKSYTLPPVPTRLISVYFNVTTSATAGTRRMYISIHQKTKPPLVLIPFTVIGASRPTAIFSASNSVNTVGKSGANSLLSPLPLGPYPATSIVTINSTGFKGGDQLHHIRITYEY